MSLSSLSVRRYGSPATVTVDVNTTSLNILVYGTVDLRVDGGAATRRRSRTGAPPSRYGLTAGNHNLTANFAAQNGFPASSATGSLRVNTAPLTITSSNESMTYGGTPPAITPTYTYDGFTNTTAPPSGLTGVVCSTTATSTSPVSGSPYPTSCRGAVASNYTISYTGSTVTVNPAPLTISGGLSVMRYGDTPTITPLYSGFVNGETAASLTTQPTCSAPGVTSSSPVRNPYLPSYATSCSGAVASNYMISYVLGWLMMIPAPLTIEVGNSIISYGGTVPAITPVYGGFVNGETAASLSTQPTCSAPLVTSRIPAAGVYGIVCSGAVDSNYTISYVPGMLMVLSVRLTISAGVSTMTYGGTVPTITPQYSGFVNGDTAASLTTQPTCSAPE